MGACTATARGAALLLPALLLPACAHRPPSLYGEPGVSAAAHVPWTPPAPARLEPVPAGSAGIPPDLAEEAQHLGLAQVLDVALRTSTRTREAWAAARAAAATYGSAKGSYLPRADLDANAQQQRTAPVGTRPAVNQKTAEAGVDASWLLFDFGGREAAIDETRQALIEADWTHNAAIQDVMLQVEEAFYAYVASRALLEAAESTREETRRNLDAAGARHDAGLATIADVLQARTADAEARLAVETLRGGIATARGALATSMGLAANAPFEVEPLPETLPEARVSDDVEEYLARAQLERPDLAAARARARGADAHVRRVKARGYPSLGASGSAHRHWVDGTDEPSDPYTVEVSLTMPLFTGFSHGYDVRASEADADAERARFDSLRQQVILQVWTSYYAFRTAEQRLAATGELVDSATQSHDVALGRYREGVGTILDLLNAQAALAVARAADVRSRADWFVSLAQLAHDTGTLEVPAAAGEGSGR